MSALAIPSIPGAVRASAPTTTPASADRSAAQAAPSYVEDMRKVHQHSTAALSYARRDVGKVTWDQPDAALADATQALAHLDSALRADDAPNDERELIQLTIRPGVALGVDDLGAVAAGDERAGSMAYIGLSTLPKLTTNLGYATPASEPANRSTPSSAQPAASPTTPAAPAPAHARRAVLDAASSAHEFASERIRGLDRRDLAIVGAAAVGVAAAGVGAYALAQRSSRNE